MKKLLYHGSPLRFDKFDMGLARDGAHFFCEDYEHASTFGTARSYMVTIHRPYVMDQKTLESRLDQVQQEPGNEDLIPRDMVRYFVDKAKQSGHDGLFIGQMADRDGEYDMYLPFSPEQIKPHTDLQELAEQLEDSGKWRITQTEEAHNLIRLTRTEDNTTVQLTLAEPFYSLERPHPECNLGISLQARSAVGTKNQCAMSLGVASLLPEDIEACFHTLLAQTKVVCCVLADNLPDPTADYDKCYIICNEEHDMMNTTTIERHNDRENWRVFGTERHADLWQLESIISRATSLREQITNGEHYSMEDFEVYEVREAKISKDRLTLHLDGSAYEL